jgi:hypothetical protein
MCFALPFIQREVRDDHTLLPDMALFVACISMMINTLPLALLNTQLKTTTAPMIVTMSE